MRTSTRIIVNTLASYVRLIFLALSGILVTPIALHVLGPSDFGIFSVIGGSLAFLLFINIALVVGAQRHIAYAIGAGQIEDVKKWFSTSVVIHVALGLTIASVALSFGHLIVYHLLKIPVLRLSVAMWIYVLVVMTMVCNVMSTPFQALLMAHESIAAVSLLRVMGALLMIGGVLCLRHLPGDSLLWYGAIYCFSQMALFLGPVAYCLYRYGESRSFSRKGLRRENLKELLGFCGWNIFGSLASVVRAQGPAILLNMFVGTVANAAYGLAIQANGFASEVSLGVLRAASPPIIKRRAAGDMLGMISLSNSANIYSLIVLWIVIGPVLFEIHFCLKFWLHKVPPETPAYVFLLLVALLVDQLTTGFGPSLQATGRIAQFEILVGGLNCCSLPVGYFMLRAGMPSISVLLAGLGASVLAGCARLWCATTTAGIPAVSWLRYVLFPAAVSIAGSTAAVLLVKHSMSGGFGRLLAVGAVNAIVVSLLMWCLGVRPDHREKLKALVSGVSQRIMGCFSPQQAA